MVVPPAPESVLAVSDVSAKVAAAVFSTASVESLVLIWAYAWLVVMDDAWGPLDSVEDAEESVEVESVVISGVSSTASVVIIVVPTNNLDFWPGIKC